MPRLFPTTTFTGCVGDPTNGTGTEPGEGHDGVAEAELSHGGIARATFEVSHGITPSRFEPMEDPAVIGEDGVVDGEEASVAGAVEGFGGGA